MKDSNISIIHLRGPSEPWKPSSYASSGRSYFASGRNAASSLSTAPPLTKHQSLSGTGGYKWPGSTATYLIGGGTDTPTQTVVETGSPGCDRELSPVRWCDREVDGVYLGKSGWVQVQRHSMDDRRTSGYFSKPPTAPIAQSKRSAGARLADYHFNSEPSRPAFLSLQRGETAPSSTVHTPPSPSPPQPTEEEYSPPSITPIISPPPAFQDAAKNGKAPSTTSTTGSASDRAGAARMFFGKGTPLLSRTNAIEDSDASPPTSPVVPPTATMSAPSTVAARDLRREAKAFGRPGALGAQAKSLEDAGARRRSQFLQHYRGAGGSSSSSSSSMGFRSLDSAFSRANAGSRAMPRLSENTDDSSSVDRYQEADDEDNNSSSINVSMLPLHTTPVVTVQQTERGDRWEKEQRVSPSGRSSASRQQSHHRMQMRRSPGRSPVGSDTNKPPGSSSSTSGSEDEFVSRSPPPLAPSPQPPTSQGRRNTPSTRPYQSRSPSTEDQLQRVRRSRSLQLPEKRPPQQAPPLGGGGRSPSDGQHRTVIKIGTAPERTKRYNSISKEEDRREKSSSKDLSTNGFTVYYVGSGGGGSKERQKVLVRGSTSPSLSSQKQSGRHVEAKPGDFWAQQYQQYERGRESAMRLSQSYPAHSRSVEVSSIDVM
ncbi:unnamed protein product [Acanthoscelides obtectus]|uniref:Uncharacterized protein n=1 Tax=Acanthoscelides obtectus TaxID=200917 RepID=A0A9P0KJ33_ACAOB|nr:unnamed protein product [Acanthoscelides obtectus]CAK1674851.1 hypothetical protein AOBTE_LOCUS29775 [Acanthoscelides obtectus]